MATHKYSPLVPSTQTTLYTTATGATYHGSLKEYALPLPELLHLNTGINNAAVGGFVFLGRSNSLLLIRRALIEPAYPGFWEVPGGAAEAPPTDETLLDAVVREVKEETGLTVTRIIRCYGTVDFAGRNGRRVWRKWNFEVEVAESKEQVLLDPKEHDAWMWVDGKEALEAAGLNILEKQKNSLLEALEIRRDEIEGAAC